MYFSNFKFIGAVVSLGVLLIGCSGDDDVTPEEARENGLESLNVSVKDEGVPLPDTLSEYVKDNDAAILLGKAFFWDMQVGSDGVTACASCHYHAGTDNREVNAINPGLARVSLDSNGEIRGLVNSASNSDSEFHTGELNGAVKREDFPLVKHIDQVNVRQTESGDVIDPVEGNSNDVIGSVGIFLNSFDGIIPGEAKDLGTPQVHDVFTTINGEPIRQVVNRNSPSIINTVFYNTQFWDGRSNPFFNGQNQFGVNIPTFIVVNDENNEPQLAQVQLNNGSLAGQPSQPVTEPNEQGFGIPGTQNTRTLPQIGVKLLANHPETGIPIQPLAEQRVHKDDSVLGEISKWPEPGVTTTSYAELIRNAFHEKYWDSDLVIDTGFEKFTHMEANFALFFGLSIMLYEATLVSDQTPFDKWMETGKLSKGFDSDAVAGLNLFIDKGCVDCHSGPELTDASVREAKNGTNLIRGREMLNGDALYDTGFHNIGVTPTTDDIGRGGSDFRDFPLAFSRQSLMRRLDLDRESGDFLDIINFPILGSQTIPTTSDDGISLICNDLNGNGFCDACVDANNNGQCDACEDSNMNGVCDEGDVGEEGGAEEILANFQRVAVDGAFKTPTLRNVELTGPYFHNGGVATLKQVVQFFNRGGNFCNTNSDNLSPAIKPLGLTKKQEDQLVTFLLSLTDERVKYKQAPFDHPELRIPVDGLEDEPSYVIEAVGEKGTDEPLETFLKLDPYDEIYTPESHCFVDAS